ncbi:protein hyper-sensitivity-related 4, partial [Nicotiana attenuata]
ILIAKIVTKGVELYKALKKISAFSNQVTMVFYEFDGQVYNEIYKAVEIYLGNKIYSENRRFKVSKPEKNFKVTLDHNEKVKDVYDGHKFKWVWLDSKSVRSNMGSCFDLTFHKKHKELAL